MRQEKLGKARGFTLIEVMIVVSVVALLAAVALPSYQKQVRRANRSEIEASMMTIAQLEERYITANNQPCTSSTTCTWLSGYAGSSHYNIAVTLLPAVSPTAYNITATPAGGYSDPDCGTLTLTWLNQKSSSAGTTATCWR